MRSYFRGAQEVIRKEVVHTNNFTFSLEPGTRFHGKIVFEDTGRPAVGARVTGWLSSPNPYVEADAAGHFSISQLPLKGYVVQIYPPENAPYLGETVEFALTEDKRAVEIIVKLRRGLPISGKVVDEEIGTGIPGVAVFHVPSTPESRRFEPSYWRALTNGDGNFRIFVAPGKGRLLIPGAPRGYSGPKEAPPGRSLLATEPPYNRQVEVHEGQNLKGVSFTLKRKPTISLSGRVVDPQGKPVAGAQAEIQGAQPPYQMWKAVTDTSGNFKIGPLPANKSATITCRHQKLMLAARLTVPPPTGREAVKVEVKLTPTASATGRVVDDDGRPVAGCVVRAGGAFATTDALGRYHLTGVLPAGEFYVITRAEGFEGTSITRLLPKFNAESGKTLSLADITLVKMDHSIAGLVVGPAGEPLGGVDIWATLDHPLSPQIRGPRPSTNSAGRFRLTGLPGGTIEIWGVLPWDRQHSRILQRVKAGDQNVKIVADPANVGGQ